MKSGCPVGPYVNHAPKTLLPCCASVSPHPDSVEVHQRSVRSTPQLVGALPKGSRWITFERETLPMVYEKSAVPGAPPVGAKSIEALPTFVVATAFGSNVGFVKDGPIAR